jgi:hypothetical protein
MLCDTKTRHLGREWSRNSFGVMSLAELPDGIILNIVKQN